MHKCRTGRHYWFAKSDAAKCCDPAWVRILLIGKEALDKSETPVIAEGGTVYGRQWIRKETL